MKRRSDEWLNLAFEDLRAAKLLFREKIFSYACFHSQQCAEKALKALIEMKGMVPKIHSIAELLKICRKLRLPLPEFDRSLVFLDKFYTLTRYPFVPGMVKGKNPNRSDSDAAIKISEKIYKFCRRIVEKNEK
ncbi:MAG: HEPN domain-containing protein [Elusimicrobia bacterium]|nr:HEPN domain-containing protein [Elusimicrobiota bacterium]